MPAWFEDIPLDFTRQETKTAARLLVTALPSGAELAMFAGAIGLDGGAINFAQPPKIVVQEMLKQARLADRMPQMIAEVLNDAALAALHPQFLDLVKGQEAELAAAALRKRPSLATLALLPPSIEVWSRTDSSAQPLRSAELEKIVNPAAGFANPAEFRMRLAEAEVRTARVDIGGHAEGTGFLVGENLLLTNWHVVRNAAAGGVAVFDNAVSPLGVGSAGRKVAFAADWLVASSDHADVDLEIGPDGPPPGTWDFALVRLAEPVGAQAIGADPQAAGADRRGHYRLDGDAYIFDQGEPVFILGHPDGRPVQFSYASPSGARLTGNANRVRYGTNTEGGSSGSPVFNRHWRVVALHHAAGPTDLPGDFNLKGKDFNQGIPIRGIVENARTQLAGRPDVLSELGIG
jgi:hypothetical protein